jgi:DNA-directed RNA polymerase specialized sigma24 family protein
VRAHGTLASDVCCDGDLDTCVRQESLWAALAALPLRDRDALEARYLRDETDEDTAMRLGIAPSTVRTRLRRALRRARELLSICADEPLRPTVPRPARSAAKVG